MNADGFLSRMLGWDTDEYDSGAYYSSEEVERRRSRRTKEVVVGGWLTKRSRRHETS